jgi:replicative DNA helicase
MREKNPDFPPEMFDPYAEQACIAAMLYGRDYTVQVLAAVNSQDFGVGQNHKIVKACEELQQSGEDVSFVTLRDKLEKDGTFIGGEDALKVMVNSFVIDLDGNLRVGTDASMIFAGCKAATSKVKDKANTRKLISLFRDLGADLLSFDSTVPDACLKARDTILQVQTNTESPAKVAADRLQHRLTRINEIQAGKQMGKPTGFRDFDDVTGGLSKGDVLLIVAPTKGAKSALSLAIADNFAKRNDPVAYFSMEMDLDETEDRRLCKRVNELNLDYTEWAGTKVNLNTIMGKSKIPMTPSQADLLRWVTYDLSKEPFYLIGPEVIQAAQVLLEAERLITQFGVTLLIFDYTQLVKGHGSDYEVFTAFAQEVKSLCNRYGVAAVLPSQVNNDAQRLARVFKRLTADDAHGSGELQKSSTIITNLYLDKEEFDCACPDDQKYIEEDIFWKGKFIKDKRRKHEFKPANGICTDCLNAKRPNPYIYEVPYRLGSWYIERGRSCAGGLSIPLQFEGQYMKFNELQTVVPDHVEKSA